MATSSQQPLELWGGVECTINRVGDRFFSQLELSGHLDRLDDLDRIAALGIRTLRYPILWEQLAPESLDAIDWRWADERLGRLRELGIRPIVGLVHHGSGPRYTSLLDPEFPQKLARFARAVAERYPWVDAFTPVNEPLTTARFSGLYGHWHPHGRDEFTFARCLLNQLRGVVLAMRAIREINPHAELVQTEDLGKIFSTPRLQYQADFENERRWITWDLLCGKVDETHRMFHHLQWLGIDAADIEWFAANPCAPNVIGVNYYVTSERFLDDNVSAHPPATVGGNGRHRYADVEAVRARPDGIAGAQQILAEAVDRYALPVAITEAHLGCSRVEQVRWLAEIWGAARTLRDRGANVTAVTAWSLFGAHNWDTLLTSDDGSYEPGAFDVRGNLPRPTALARTIRALAASSEFSHPALSMAGWWHRPIRFIPRIAAADEPLVQTDTRRLLIIRDSAGVADGFEIGACERALATQSINAADDAEIDLADQPPWAAICCELSETAVGIAAACARRGIPFVALSSAAVFQGTKQEPYVETDAADAQLERKIIAAHSSALVIRAGEIFGTWQPNDLVLSTISALAARRPFRAASNVIFSTTYVADLVAAVLDLLVDGETGVWHLAHQSHMTHAALAHTIAEVAGFRAALIQPEASQPTSSRALRSARGELLPSLASALSHYIAVVVAHRAESDRIASGQ